MELTSRKFWMAVGVIVIATTLLVLKIISEMGWQVVVLASLTGYYTVNQIEAARESVKNTV